MKFAVAGAVLAIALAPTPWTITAAQAAPHHPLATVPERQSLALHFYQRTGWKPGDIGSHLSGIDFSKPVRVVRLRPGAKVMQYRFPARPTGNYSTPIGTNPATLGINPAGRQAVTLTVSTETRVLRSVASDTSAAKDLPVWSRGHGGGVQYFAVSTAPFHDQK